MVRTLGFVIAITLAACTPEPGPPPETMNLVCEVQSHIGHRAVSETYWVFLTLRTGQPRYYEYRGEAWVALDTHKIGADMIKLREESGVLGQSVRASEIDRSTGRYRESWTHVTGDVIRLDMGQCHPTTAEKMPEGLPSFDAGF
ncbi:MAG: hypothetical protein AAFR73_12075 [Pseudomonadota bacterium]